MKIGRILGENNVGLTETMHKYAYFPKIMTNGDLIWLEKYTETRIWESYLYKPYMTDLKDSEPYIDYRWNIINRERLIKND